MQSTPPHELPNAALLSAIHSHVIAGRHALAQLLLCLYQVEKRLLHAERGFGSLFAYVRHLGFSEGESWRRVAAARVVGTYPQALAGLVEGRLSLTTVSMLWRHLDAVNGNALLRKMEGLGKAEVEALLAQRGYAGAPKVAPRLRPVVVRQGPRTPAQGSLLEAPPKQFAPPAAAIESFQSPKAPGCAAVRGATLAATATTTATADNPRADDDGRSAEVGTIAPVRETPTCMYRLQLTLTPESRAALQQAQCLLRHRLPHGDYNEIVALALQDLVAKLERAKACRLMKAADPVAQARAAANPKGLQLPMAPGPDSIKPAHACAAAAPKAPAVASGSDNIKAVLQPSVAPGPDNSVDEIPCQLRVPTPGAPAGKRSRAIPRAVRRRVYERDGGVCAYTASGGRRCGAQAFLEYHHKHAFAWGGAHTVDNIELRCRLHNQYEALVAMGLGSTKGAAGRPEDLALRLQN